MKSEHDTKVNLRARVSSKRGFVGTKQKTSCQATEQLLLLLRHTRQRHCSLDEDEEASVASTSPGEAAASSGYNNNSGSEKQNHGHKNNKADETSRLCEK